MPINSNGWPIKRKVKWWQIPFNVPKCFNGATSREPHARRQQNTAKLQGQHNQSYRRCSGCCWMGWWVGGRAGVTLVRNGCVGSNNPRCGGRWKRSRFKRAFSNRSPRGGGGRDSMSNRTESRIWSICGSIWSELGVPTGMGSLELPVLMLPGVMVLLVLVC